MISEKEFNKIQPGMRVKIVNSINGTIMCDAMEKYCGQIVTVKERKYTDVFYITDDPKWLFDRSCVEYIVRRKHNITSVNIEEVLTFA